MRAESTFKTSIAVALATCALTAPVAVAGQDLRSPDARDAAVSAATQDLRSPDARDAANVPPSPEQRTYRNLVSPDARDSGRVIPQPQPVAPKVDKPGFQWDDAGIGGGVVAGLLALLGAGVVARRRHHAGTPAVS